VIYGVQEQRKGPFVERLTGKIFYRVFNLLSATPIPENVMTVRLMTRAYTAALVSHQEREITIAGLWALTGFRQLPMPVKKTGRARPSYTFRHRVAILVGAITGFSNRPLIAIFYLGSFIVLLSGAAGGVLVIRRLLFGGYLSGWVSLIVSVWLLGGLSIFALGVIGMYLSKVFMETKQRPNTIVRHVHEHGHD
jgi:putative glycosyltransferase